MQCDPRWVLLDQYHLRGNRRRDARVGDLAYLPPPPENPPVGLACTSPHCIDSAVIAFGHVTGSAKSSPRIAGSSYVSIMASKTYQIAVLPGDGIGPEVVEQATRVLERVSEKSSSVKLELKSVGDE